jgi:tetratricopeptide (TPR) repeat protein
VPAGGQTQVYWVWAVCVFLLVAVGLVFGQTVDHEFLGHDDNAFVYENPHVTAGLTLSGIWWALTDGPYGEWTPLSTLTHMLDCQLYGLTPAGHHLTNLLLHAASSVLLFLVLLRMTGDLWPSAWVAAVFAVHPLHVESVAWVAERRDVLSGLFFMLTLGGYALYAERPSLARYLAVACCFALGMTAKPMLVTVPFVLLLLDYWPLDRFPRAAGARPPAEPGWGLRRLSVGWRLVLEKIPLVALAAVDCGIVMSTHASLRNADQVDRLLPATRLANALVSYAAYVGQSFYPVDLSPFYPHLGTQLAVARVAEAFFLLVTITAVAAYWWRRLPCLLVGWLWFLGMLVPVSGLAGTFLEGRADRYTYLSQIGLSIAVAWGVWSFYQSRKSRRAVRFLGWPLGVVSAVVVLLLAAVAWRQTSYWRDSEAVWTRAVSCTEQNSVAHSCLAGVYARQGRTEEAIAQAREALATYSIGRYLNARAHALLGHCLAKQGHLDEALTHYEQSVRMSPATTIFRERLAMELAIRGKFGQSVAEWREVLRLDPNRLPARLGLANALLANGDASEAAAECREVLKSERDLAQAIVTLGVALAADGKAEEALPYLERAVEFEPQNAEAHFRLGLALYGRGHAQRAVAQLHEAVHLEPDSVPKLWQTAWILATSADPSVRDGARAVELAKRAIRISDGHDVHSFDALAAGLAEINEFPAAVEAAEKASMVALIGDDGGLAEAIEQRAGLYRQGLPYREPGSPAASEQRDVRH